MVGYTLGFALQIDLNGMITADFVILAKVVTKKPTSISLRIDITA
jgi:hypothetical protein